MDINEKLRYPIGYFIIPDNITKEVVTNWINKIESLPARLTNVVSTLTQAQLDTPYRPDGWTLRQVIHHIADSHHHSYTRFKWALTEDMPLIKAYQEKEWSALLDAKNAPIDLSLTYIHALHAKLVFLLKSLDQDQLSKHFIHPDGMLKVSLAENIGKYAWHGDHHLAHIQNLVRTEGW